jgi:hypothetical protein
MERGSEQGFTLLELTVASATLLILLGAALGFFARSQVVYTGERLTSDMVQDMRTVFDRFTNEIRMAGSGLPAPRGVILGTATTLVVRGDFSEKTTIITSTGTTTISGSTATFPVGTTSGFAAGQTISLLNNATGASALVKITAVDTTNSTLSVDTSDMLPLTSGASMTDFSAGAIINVIERRTYSIISSTDPDMNGAITRKVAYEDTLTAGNVVQDTEIIAKHVLAEDGSLGLNFTYYQADGSSAGDEDGVLNPDVTKKVQVQIKSRSVRPDPQTGKYRTFLYTALVQVRGQYAPSVGY